MTARCRRSARMDSVRQGALTTSLAVMSSADYREPTNDELWAQPPATPQPPPASQEIAPVSHPLPPAPIPQLPVPGPQQRPDRTTFVLAIVSIALGIPLTAIASGTAGLPGLLVVWIGIVLVNFVYARSRHR